MKKMRLLPFLIFAVVLSACVLLVHSRNGTQKDERLEAPPPTAPETQALPDPSKTPNPEELALSERQEKIEQSVDIIKNALYDKIDAEDFLLWLGVEKFPEALEALPELDAPDASEISRLLLERTGESLFVLSDRYLDLVDTLGTEIYTAAGEREPDGRTVLAFGGDINLTEGADGYVMPVLRAAGDLSEVLKDGLLDEMRSADVLLLNNEFAYTNSATPLAGKMYVFRSPPENVEILAEMGCDIAYLANNHVYDFGAAGLSDTLQTLRDAEIAYIGAGMDIDEASRPVYFIAGGRKIAYIGAGCIERYTVYTPGASETSPGIFRADEVNNELLLELISAAAERSDYVIVKLHWGIESTTVLEDYQRTLGQMCIDVGADAVIGSHPHVLQGAQFYNGAPIIYSIGNFWFSRTNVYTCLLQLIIDDTGLSVKLVPCITGGGITRLVTGQEAQKIFEYYESISFNARVSEDGIISQTQ